MTLKTVRIEPREEYKKVILEASEDKLYIDDMKEIEDAFFYAANRNYFLK